MDKPKKKGLLDCPKCIRNLCIMAHVDHGKTTLADALIASNGLITQRQAGKIRYMDSRKDEVERGITMKSSCVTLTHRTENEAYVINLIDSPGHVDFSSEVSTAVRLCDGTIIVVDVVEGVCAQTKVVLRQAWLEHIKPVLVLNKIDRLILEIKLAPVDTYYHLTKLLEQVNAFMGELYNTDVLGRITEEDIEAKKLARERKFSEGRRISEGSSSTHVFSDWYISDVDDSDIYFSPERGNVVFASAYDGWGFRIEKFAEKFHKKLELDLKSLHDALWGDFCLTSKGGNKQIVQGAREKGKKPLFVSVILDNLYKLYETIMMRKDVAETEKIAQSLGIKLPVSIIKCSDPRVKLNYILSSWLPLYAATLDMIVEHLPSAADITEDRASKLMCSATQRFDSLPIQTQKLRDCFVNCRSDEEAPLIVYVSKMFGIDRNCISHKSIELGTKEPLVYRQGVVSEEEIEARRRHIQTRLDNQANNERAATDKLCDEEKDHTQDDTNNDDDDADEEYLIAFARVFSGTLRVGQMVYVLGPKHNPNNILAQTDEKGNLLQEYIKKTDHIHTCEVKEIFLLLGRHFESVKSAPAGSVIGIGGLSGILKSATLSSTPFCPAFTELTLQATPILRVAVEPSDPRDLPKLRKGLKILNQADPCVQVRLQDSGEYIIITAGEVHLQRCIEDLKERYAKVDVVVSPPIVPFRETIIPSPTVDRLNEAILGENIYVGKNEDIKFGFAKVKNNLGSLKVQAVPLPPSVVALLEKNSRLLHMITAQHMGSGCTKNVSYERTFHSPCISDISLLPSLNESLPSINELSVEALSAIKQFKSQLHNAFEEAGHFWSNAVNQIWSFGPHFTGCNILLNRIKSYPRPSIWDWTMKLDSVDSPLIHFDTNFVTGFQIATAAGPLCEEPMMGVCFVVEDWQVNIECMSTISNVISLSKETLRKAFESSHQRLMCAMYSCVVSVTSEVVGKLYNLLGKRLGRVIDGDITEGSTSWNVVAYLPVIESFNFANELMKTTSGEAMPQLLFSHWEVLDIDPFWEPQTVEELIHWGEKADSENLARKYINAVRRRKGLPTDDKIVEFAEKQRNLSRNK